ncbi:Putative glutathione-regulated potassium-efflux system protein KefB [hydrothermal vent metagenome]|uniref:Glutathione-regulated potassium-efflux system protein KefB n=1 Tax=hydrothermal vent metagenome TaxID=652676 RepID=A0A3B0VK85_9ZZZZ
MDFEWVTLALNDFLWIGLTFILGLFAKQIGLPPMVGFLAAGFLLSTQNIVDRALLGKMADLGITLLLFTIGLKINVKNLLRPQVWAVSSIHGLVTVAFFGLLVYVLALMGTPLFNGITIENALLIAFALSFSSTVFVVKAMENKGEMDSFHGRIAIGVLIIQDIFAVLFLAISANKMPSIWSLALLLLIPLRSGLFWLIEQVGRGELLIVYGFLLAIGGAEIFELVGIKGDLGALIIGMMFATHPKSTELVKTMLGFKDLFLLGFFLSIGLNGQPTTEVVIAALVITPLVLLKSTLFFTLFVKFKLRARTALLSTISLSNYSEFGLIVIAICVTNGWVDAQWLTIMALSIAFSFVVSAVLNKHAHNLYNQYRRTWKKFQTEERLPNDKILDMGDAGVAVIGMGAVGTGAYDQLIKKHGNHVVGVDIDPDTVLGQQKQGRHVILGDPSDADFWDRVNKSHQLKWVLLTLPHFSTSMAVIEQLHASGFSGEIAATAKFSDEIERLNAAGVDTVFNMYTEAGAGFAAHVLNQTQ